MRTATASRTERALPRSLRSERESRRRRSWPGTFHACGDRIVVPDGVERPRLEQDAPGRVECPRRWATCTARWPRPSPTEVRRQDFLKSYCGYFLAQAMAASSSRPSP